MTVHVHRNIGSVGYGDHHHDAPELDDERTWSFDCTAECEERVTADAEFAARNAAGVPLTVEEKAEEELLETKSQKDVSNLARALGKLAKDDIVGASA